MTTREVIRTTVQQKGFWVALSIVLLIVGLCSLLLLLLWPEAFVYLCDGLLNIFGRGSTQIMVMPQ